MSNSYDVILIGSGAGGGTIAHRMAPSGKRVLLRERGGWLHDGGEQRHHAHDQRHDWPEDPELSAGDAAVQPGAGDEVDQQRRDDRNPST
jgi:choline dehydrogenase-like flavoprotein